VLHNWPQKPNQYILNMVPAGQAYSRNGPNPVAAALGTRKIYKFSTRQPFSLYLLVGRYVTTETMSKIYIDLNNRNIGKTH
jgi:hypothetical protein